MTSMTSPVERGRGISIPKSMAPQSARSCLFLKLHPLSDLFLFVMLTCLINKTCKFLHRALSICCPHAKSRKCVCLTFWASTKPLTRYPLPTDVHSLSWNQVSGGEITPHPKQRLSLLQQLMQIAIVCNLVPRRSDADSSLKCFGGGKSPWVPPPPPMPQPERQSNVNELGVCFEFCTISEAPKSVEKNIMRLKLMTSAPIQRENCKLVP